MDRPKAFAGIGQRFAGLGEKGRELFETRAFQRAFRFIAGFGLSFSAMGSSIAPFGVSYVAMCPQDSLFAAAGAFAGYMLAYGMGGLVYAATVLIAFTCRIVFKDTSAAKTPYLMPACAFASLLCVKSVIALEDGLMGLLILLCEAVLCAGFCLLFDTARFEERPDVQTGVLWGRIAVAVAVLLVFQGLRVSIIAPARVAASLVVMITACFSGSAMGAASGVAVGACMDIAVGSGPFFAAAYGFSGLIGGLGGQRSRFACAICHVMANCVATMWGNAHPSATAGLFECFVASVIFVMLPDSVFSRLNITVRRRETAVARPAGQRAFAMGRLQAVSTAIGELGATLEGFLGQTRQIGRASCRERV